MKEKVFEKMREYGWNLGNNTDEDFKEVYNIHYNFIEGCYDYIVDNDINKELDFNSLNKQEMEDMITFMSDFLRAINDIDDIKKIGSAKISLYNSHNVGYALSNMCLYDTKDIEYCIRKCEFNAQKLCNLLNKKSDELVYDNWSVAMELDDMIVVKGTDKLENIVYLEIKL